MLAFIDPTGWRLFFQPYAPFSSIYPKSGYMEVFYAHGWLFACFPKQIQACASQAGAYFVQNPKNFVVNVMLLIRYGLWLFV
jgi:hypothetical protein